MIKAVATDIDRTLTISGNNYKLTVEAVKAIRVLEEHGIPVILISGNSLPIVVGLRDISGPVLGENGCVIFYKKVENTMLQEKRQKRCRNRL